MGFEITLSSDGENLTIAAPKRCTYESWKKSKLLWLSQDYSNVKECSIDFSRTVYIDSSGIGALLTLKELLQDGTEIVCVKMNDRVRSVFDIINISKLFTII